MLERDELLDGFIFEISMSISSLTSQPRGMFFCCASASRQAANCCKHDKDAPFKRLAARIRFHANSGGLVYNDVLHSLAKVGASQARRSFSINCFSIKGYNLAR